MTERCRCRGLTRRRLLTYGGVVIGGVLAGCLERGEDSAAGLPDPIDLTEGHVCHACGMVIGAHPGVTAQLYPDGDETLPFDSVREALSYVLDGLSSGELDQVGYVADLSKASYETEVIDGVTYLWVDTQASVFSPLGSVVYVIDSSARGAMGQEVWPMGEEHDAQAFIDHFGGEIVEPSQLQLHHLDTGSH